MLDQRIRQTILSLREAGNGIRAIARALGVSRLAVKRVLAGGSPVPPLIERAEKAEAHRDDIVALVAECRGNLVRVHEELHAGALAATTWANYAFVLLQSSFPRFFLNSVIVSLGTAVCVTVVASAAGYAFSRFDFRWKRALVVLMLLSVVLDKSRLLESLASQFAG